MVQQSTKQSTWQTVWSTKPMTNNILFEIQNFPFAFCYQTTKTFTSPTTVFTIFSEIWLQIFKWFPSIFNYWWFILFYLFITLFIHLSSFTSDLLILIKQFTIHSAILQNPSNSSIRVTENSRIFSLLTTAFISFNSTNSFIYVLMSYVILQKVQTSKERRKLNLQIYI